MLKRALSARYNKQKGHFLDHGTFEIALIPKTVTMMSKYW